MSSESWAPEETVMRLAEALGGRLWYATAPPGADCTAGIPAGLDWQPVPARPGRPGRRVTDDWPDDGQPTDDRPDDMTGDSSE